MGDLGGLIKTMTPGQFNRLIQSKRQEINQLVNRTLPVKVGVMAKAHFQANFEKSGFVNNGLKKWKPAKRLSNPKLGAYGKNKTLLSERNHLFSSINYLPGVAQVKIVNPVHYAAVHNEGLKAGRGKGFMMPKRQFIGQSAELDNKVQDTIHTELKKILNI